MAFVICFTYTPLPGAKLDLLSVKAPRWYVGVDAGHVVTNPVAWFLSDQGLGTFAPNTPSKRWWQGRTGECGGGWGRRGETDRETDRDRQRQKERETETEGQREEDRETERDRDRGTDRQTARQREEIKADTDEWVDGQMENRDRQTDRRTDRGD